MRNRKRHSVLSEFQWMIWTLFLLTLIATSACDLFFDEPPVIVIETSSLVVLPGGRISLNGSKSYVVWGTPELDFEWVLISKPSGSAANIQGNPHIDSIDIITDELGSYTLQLRVSTHRVVSVEEITLQAKNLPTTPQNVVVGNPTGTSLTITWNPVDSTTSYRVYRDVSESGTFSTLVGTVTVNEYVDSDLDPLTTYWYKIFALNELGSSDSSPAKSGTTTELRSDVVLSIAQSGTGTVTGGGNYRVGDTITIAAVAEYGWIFDHWACPDNVVLTNAQIEITVHEVENQYIAHFVPHMVEIEVVANPSNGGTATGGGSFQVGTITAINARPSSGWRFIRWNDNDTNSEKTITVPVGGGAYTAFFQKEATVSAQASPSNGGHITGTGTYLVGESITLNALADQGWRFVRWSDNNTSGSRQLIVPDGGMFLTAYFERETATVLVYAQPPEGGTVTGTGAYTIGSTVIINASPNNGWRFIRWADNITNPTRTITVPANGITYTAYFEQAVAVITVQASPSNGGSVSGSGTYSIGSSINIVASPISGWRFVRWNDNNTNQSRWITVPAGGATYTAYFEQNNATIQVVASPNNGGSVGGGGSYSVGSSVNLVAYPNNGWRFIRWNDNNTSQSRWITVPAGGATYTAYFQALTATVTLSRNHTSGGSVSGGGTFALGGVVSISATPYSGWEFRSWSDGDTNRTRTFTLNGNVNLTAIFQKVFIDEGFEGNWYYYWNRGENSWANTGRYWGDNWRKKYSGDWSAFCAYPPIDNTTYVNDMNTYLQKPNLSFEGFSHVEISYAIYCNTEQGFDGCELTVKDEYGGWSVVWSESGFSNGWQIRTLNLDRIAGDDDVTVNFDFISDGSLVGANGYRDIPTGVWLDDVKLIAY